MFHLIIFLSVLTYINIYTLHVYKKFSIFTLTIFILLSRRKDKLLVFFLQLCQRGVDGLDIHVLKQTLFMSGGTFSYYLFRSLCLQISVDAVISYVIWSISTIFQDFTLEPMDYFKCCSCWHLSRDVSHMYIVVLVFVYNIDQ